jgi:hypothetical protein
MAVKQSKDWLNRPVVACGGRGNQTEKDANSIVMRIGVNDALRTVATLL